MRFSFFPQLKIHVILIINIILCLLCDLIVMKHEGKDCTYTNMLPGCLYSGRYWLLKEIMLSLTFWSVRQNVSDIFPLILTLKLNWNVKAFAMCIKEVDWAMKICITLLVNYFILFFKVRSIPHCLALVNFQLGQRADEVKNPKELKRQQPSMRRGELVSSSKPDTPTISSRVKMAGILRAIA